MQAEHVVGLAGDLAHRPPLHRPEDDVRRAELEEAELLQQLIHVDRARDRLEPVVRDEQDEVVVARARDERADRVVELLVDVAHLRADRGLLVAGGVRVVGRDVVRERVLRAVDAHPDGGHQVPVRVVHQPLGRADPLAGDLERLVQVRVGLVAERRPRHAVDRPGHAGPLELLGQVGRVRVRAALRQHPAGDDLPLDLRRREHQRDVGVHPDLAGRREVLDERPLLDRAVGDRVLLVRSGDGLEDVVDAVIGRVDTRQERRPGRPRVGRHGRAQDVLLPRSIRACRFGRSPRSSRGSRMRQSAPSHPMSNTRGKLSSTQTRQ